LARVSLDSEFRRAENLDAKIERVTAERGVFAMLTWR